MICDISASYMQCHAERKAGHPAIAVVPGINRDSSCPCLSRAAVLCFVGAIKSWMAGSSRAMMWREYRPLRRSRLRDHPPDDDTSVHDLFRGHAAGRLRVDVAEALGEPFALGIDERSGAGARHRVDRLAKRDVAGKRGTDHVRLD